MQTRWGWRRSSVLLAPLVATVGMACGTSPSEGEDAGNPFNDDSSVQQAPLDAAMLPDAPHAGGATIIDTRGVIAPGLIDTHNHILFDIFDDDDWLPTKAYTNHDQWPNEARYQAMLDVKQCLEDASQGKPTWCPATY